MPAALAVDDISIKFRTHSPTITASHIYSANLIIIATDSPSQPSTSILSHNLTQPTTRVPTSYPTHELTKLPNQAPNEPPVQRPTITITLAPTILNTISTNIAVMINKRNL